MKAIMALIEDKSGEAIVLQLYQQEDEESCKVTDIVNVGTILIVKELDFKVMGDGDARSILNFLSPMALAHERVINHRLHCFFAS